MPLCSILFMVLSSTTFINSLHIVHDSVKAPNKSDQHGEVLMGTSLPDWTDASLDGRKRYIETILVIDPELQMFYNYNNTLLRRGLDMLMYSVNQFMYQINIRIVAVDVYTEMTRYNMSLDDFSRWRDQNMGVLVPHDVAILLRLRYEGGIAYVGGICGRNAVGVSGFFPESPFEFAAVFVHEMAHLLGLSHNSGTQCKCRDWQNCLRIDGFERDCAVQALVDMLPKQQCIQDAPSSLPHTHLPICGNGLIERNEECDCGPTKFCWNPLCESTSCHLIISPNTIYVIIICFSIITIILIINRLRFCCNHREVDPSLSSKMTSISSSPQMNEKKERHFEFPPIVEIKKGAVVSLDDILPIPSPISNIDMEGYVKMYPPIHDIGSITLKKRPIPPPPRRTDKNDEIQKSFDIANQLNTVLNKIEPINNPITPPKPKPPPPPPAACSKPRLNGSLDRRSKIKDQSSFATLKPCRVAPSPPSSANKVEERIYDIPSIS